MRSTWLRPSIEALVLVLVSIPAYSQAPPPPPPPSGGTPNQINPANQIMWPKPCSGVYAPGANQCVPPGTAANPAGNPYDFQINAGGTFGISTGMHTDASGNLSMT